MISTLNILVISDLHAHSGDPRSGDAPSYFSTNSLYSSSDINPLISIPQVINRAGLKVDWLISPGDLGDRANPSAQVQAWNELKRIKEELGASQLIGTAGNHDIDSRRSFPEFDPKSSLQLLVPGFPLQLDCYNADDRVYIDRFWSRNFVVVPFEQFDCTLLLLNSCAFHGYSSDPASLPNEHVRGRLSPLTRAAIETAIRGITSRVNITLLHHHVIKHPYIDDGNSLMIGGDMLIDTLKETKKQWLIVHGHQHTPYLSYADATAFAPTVLSAGSVSAKTYRVKGGHPRNQIHHIAIPVSSIEPGGVEILGRVTTWTWAFEQGWQNATPDGGIPYQSGFGYRFSAVDTRDKIVLAAKKVSPQLLNWSEVIANAPKLNYLVPQDREDLISMLKALSVGVEVDTYGTPIRLEWRG
jgi:hypothetical protein